MIQNNSILIASNMNMYLLLIGSTLGLTLVTTSDSFLVTLLKSVAAGEPLVTEAALVFLFCP